MPSLYQEWCRDDPYDARMKNLAKARNSPRYHPPRPWRSSEESEMIRRYAFWWYTCRDHNKPSARSWAKELGVSHTWLQKLVRKFQEDPGEIRRLQAAHGDPTLSQLSQAREYTREMRERGELRVSMREKWERFFERYPEARDLYPEAASAVARAPLLRPTRVRRRRNGRGRGDSKMLTT
jgi:hypothetical protein